MGLRDDPQGVSVANDDEVVDRNLAVTGEPIIGTDKIILVPWMLAPCHLLKA